MSIDPIPTNILEVHDLLSETLVLANDSGVRFEYGLALFPRRGRFDAPVFGVVTRGGESTTLTYRMLQTLADQPVWLSGRVIAMLGEGNAIGSARVAPTGLLDQPVLHLLITSWAGPDPSDMDRTAGLDSLIYAGELKAPVVLLVPRRPPGWPL